MALTAAEVKKFLRTPPKRRRLVSDGRSLYLDLTPNGNASWLFKYRSPIVKEERKDKKTGQRVKTNIGAKRPFLIGDARDPKLGLTKAREEADKLRVTVKAGRDPLIEREKTRETERAALLARKGQLTLADMLDQWMTSPAAKRWAPSTRDGYEIHVRTRIKPALGDLPVGEVSKADVKKLLRDVYADKPPTSSHVLATIRLAYNWAIEQDLVKASPCAEVKKLHKKKDEKADRRKRYVIYTDEQVRQIYASISGENGDLIRLLFRTSTRIHETQAVRWEDVDLDAMEWTIPPEDAKEDRPHVVPLTRGALAILREREEKSGGDERGFVFPAHLSACEK